MKNVFGMNVRAEVREFDGAPLIVRRVEGGLVKKQQELSKDIDAQEKLSRLPNWVTILALIAATAGVICLGAFFKAAAELGFGEAFARGSWAVYAGVPLIVVGIAVYVWAKVRKARTEASSAHTYVEERARKVSGESREALGIPEDAAHVDVFGLSYVLKGGRQKPVSTLAGRPYVNVGIYAFREGDDLCLADDTFVMKIPLHGISRIVGVEKRLGAMGWNKEVAPNKGKYKKYKIRVDQFGNLFYKPYYRMQLTAEGEEFEVLIPPYEIEHFTRLTGRIVE